MLQRRRIIVMSLIAWLPLLVHQRLQALAITFHERNLVPEAATERLDAAIASAYRLRNSVPGEVLLVAFVYVIGITIIWRHYSALHAATWYATPTVDGSSLTPAGVWFGYVSLPLFQFLMCRWYFRIFIWTRLLWQVSRIELNLVPTHPDRVGGLGFLAATSHAFIPLLMAHGTLAQRYVREFDAKWVRWNVPADEPILGTGDIQSLADLGNSFSIIQDMRVVPVTKQAMFQLAATTMAPIVPLLLTLMPLEDLIKKLFGILF